MKIVNRKTFLELPSGIVYSRYQSLGSLSSLEVKESSGGVLGNDWVYTNLISSVECNDSGEFSEIMMAAEESGSEFKLDVECGERDGFFEEDELFAVYDRDDLAKLHKRISTVLKNYPE